MPVPKACNFIKREALAQVFSWEFCKISKNTFSHRTAPEAASESNLVTVWQRCKISTVFLKI